MKNDHVLRQDVQDELEWEPSINAARIGVAIKGGAVTLSGDVDSFADKWGAERAALRVSGVKAVANEIQVRPPGDRDRADGDIANAALTALKWHSQVPDERIKLTVANGWITLQGSLDWHYQKTEAERAVRPLIGVKGVINEITVKAPAPTPSQIKGKIESAFKRSAELDAGRIHVETYDGKVILRGTVRSWVEREEAQRTAWGAPGVSSVENHIAIGD